MCMWDVCSDTVVWKRSWLSSTVVCKCSAEYSKPHYNDLKPEALALPPTPMWPMSWALALLCLALVLVLVLLLVLCLMAFLRSLVLEATWSNYRMISGKYDSSACVNFQCSNCLINYTRGSKLKLFQERVHRSLSLGWASEGFGSASPIEVPPLRKM